MSPAVSAIAAENDPAGGGLFRIGLPGRREEEEVRAAW